jgi:hypothetical protein
MGPVAAQCIGHIFEPCPHRFAAPTQAKAMPGSAAIPGMLADLMTASTRWYDTEQLRPVSEAAARHRRSSLIRNTQADLHREDHRDCPSHCIFQRLIWVDAAPCLDAGGVAFGRRFTGFLSGLISGENVCRRGIRCRVAIGAARQDDALHFPTGTFGLRDGPGHCRRWACTLFPAPRLALPSHRPTRATDQRSPFAQCQQSRANGRRVLAEIRRAVSVVRSEASQTVSCRDQIEIPIA